MTVYTHLASLGLAAFVGRPLFRCCLATATAWGKRAYMCYCVCVCLLGMCVDVYVCVCMHKYMILSITPTNMHCSVVCWLTSLRGSTSLWRPASLLDGRSMRYCGFGLAASELVNIRTLQIPIRVHFVKTGIVNPRKDASAPRIQYSKKRSVYATLNISSPCPTTVPLPLRIFLHAGHTRDIKHHKTCTQAHTFPETCLFYISPGLRLSRSRLVHVTRQVNISCG